MKKRLQTLKDWWLDLEGKKRFYLIAATIGLIFCGFILLRGDNSLIKEENYVAAEKIVHSISEQKNVVQTIDAQKINSYNVEFDEDGSIEIQVNGRRCEIVKAKLSSDYQFKSLQRENQILWCIIVFIFACTLVSFVGSIVLHLLYFVIKFIVKGIGGKA